MRSAVFLLLFLLLLAPVMAVTTYKEFGVYSGDKTYWINFPYWVGVNETGVLYVKNISGGAYAEASLNGGNASNMTYLTDIDAYRSYVLSPNVETANITIMIKNVSGDTLFNGNDTLRFAIPFNLTFSFFKTSTTANTESNPYKNEFQYVVLKYGSTKKDLVLGKTQGVAFTNTVRSLLPGDNKQTIPISSQPYLWGRVNNGVATVKAYDTASYDLYIIGSKVYGDINYYEFNIPVNNNDQKKVKTSLVNALEVKEQQNQYYNVFISQWEIFKWHLMKNFLLIGLILFVWGAVVVYITGLITALAGLDGESKGAAFVAILGAMMIATGVIPIIAIRLLVL
jgi:hypothetical protein